MFWPTIILLVLVGTISGGSGETDTVTSPTSESPECILPEPWKGVWYQKDFQSSFVIIDDHSISRGNDEQDNLGKCLKKVKGVNYIFENRHDNSICTKCLFIEAFHQNVLHYKESLCAEDDDRFNRDDDTSWDHLCNVGQGQPYFLFKHKPEPIPCPFRGGPYSFSYSMMGGSQVCSHPASTVGSCMYKSQLLLKYQACHDRTEGRPEEITCIGEWKSGDHHFLAAEVAIHNGPGRKPSPIDGQYRCFVYDEIKEEDGKLRKSDLVNVGYKVGISETATCDGLRSPDEGIKVLTLYKDKEEQFCKFPNWFTSKTWHTLDHHIMFESSPSDDVVFINLEKAFDRPKTEAPQEAQMTCWNSKNDGNTEISLVATAVQGCHVQNICIKLAPKTDFIAQVQIADHDPSFNTEDFVAECLNIKNSSSSLSFTVFTLLSDQSKLEACPHMGQFHMTKFQRAGRNIAKFCDSADPLERHPKQLDIGCLAGQTKMEFMGGCEIEINDVDEESGRFVSECLGSWQDDDVEYLVTSFTNKDKGSHPLIYCFQVYNDTDHLTVLGLPGNCPMGTKLQPNSKSLSFKLIPQGPCTTALYETDSESPGNLLTLGSGASHLHMQLSLAMIFFSGAAVMFVCIFK